MGKMNRLFAMTDSVKDVDASSPTKKKTGKIGGLASSRPALRAR
jgi:hypothetical protein